MPAIRPAQRARKKEKRNARPRGRERWLRWKTMLDEGVYESRSALARGEGVSPAAVTMGLQKLAVAATGPETCSKATASTDHIR